MDGMGAAGRVDFIVGRCARPRRARSRARRRDAVIHLAAKVGLGVDVGDLPDYASSNDAGTAELLAAMARANVMRLTLASSMVVYGEGLGRCPEHGAVTPAPRNEAALAAGKFEPPCPVCGRSSRPRWSAKTRRSIRATPTPPAKWRRNFMPPTGRARPAAASRPCAITMSMVRACRATRPMPASPPSSPRRCGGAKRRRCSRTDASGATSCMCGTSRPRPCWPAKHAAGVRAFNVGSGTPRTVGDMARRSHKRSDGRNRSLPASYRLGDVRHITADSSRLRGDLDWAPRIDFAQGMAELANA